MIKQDVKDYNNELRDYVDDMVLFKEGYWRGSYKRTLHILDGSKKQIDRNWTGSERQKGPYFCAKQNSERIWHQRCPDYKGRVGQA
eukprot:16451362-Heterocapsa_arctica.AAC.1